MMPSLLGCRASVAAETESVIRWNPDFSNQLDKPDATFSDRGYVPSQRTSHLPGDVPVLSVTDSNSPASGRNRNADYYTSTRSSSEWFDGDSSRIRGSSREDRCATSRNKFNKKGMKRKYYDPCGSPKKKKKKKKKGRFTSYCCTVCVFHRIQFICATDIPVDLCSLVCFVES